MAEVTAFGKILRKMRIDTSEVLGDMAKRLGVSAAYLSSIENNGREIPDAEQVEELKELLKRFESSGEHSIGRASL